LDAITSYQILLSGHSGSYFTIPGITQAMGALEAAVAHRDSGFCYECKVSRLVLPLTWLKETAKEAPGEAGKLPTADDIHT
jgi:hypothetical protein